MFSQKVVTNLSKSSWIRAMFEEGEKLKKIYGADKVYDFSIGNPEIEPPASVKNALKKLVYDETPGIHRYMSNAGFLDVRNKVAKYIESQTDVKISADNIVMTCGAAGGLNVVLKSILNPGEEVIVLAPYFVEYLFYIDNHGGIPVIAKTNPETFEPCPLSIEKVITPKTKAIILNSPNNPTGVIYSQKTLEQLQHILRQKQDEFGTSIFVISDEPYANIVYEDINVPSVFNIFPNSIIVNSFSKSLALPGERIGYIAVNPQIKNVETLLSALVFCNRTLGFVNAPALMQKVVSDSLNETVDINYYKQRRDILYNHLAACGFKCIKPAGAFYLFPQAPEEDDVSFCKNALKYNILLVPGQGFGCPGHFRISYCVGLNTINNSLDAFSKLAKEYGLIR